jgi:hypothetical protein
MITTITALQTVTATGPTTSASVAGITGDWTLTVHVVALSAGGLQPGARIVIEESVNAFATSVPVAVLDIAVPVTGSAIGTWRQYQIAMSKVGQAGALWRANVYYLNGISPSLTFEAWINS